MIKAYLFSVSKGSFFTVIADSLPAAELELRVLSAMTGGFAFKFERML